MIENSVFDMWAGEYDEEVRFADENNKYPFAGYKKMMDCVYAKVNGKGASSVLDVGIGTGTLSAALQKSGHFITGIDFSSEMLAIARQKVPAALLYKCDIAKGLPPEISGAKYDFIISTYALHHLPDAVKAEFIKSLLPYLCENGAIIIGDIGFASRDELNECRAENADDWDDDEYYFVFSELANSLADTCAVSFKIISHCAGILEIGVRP